MNDPTNRNFEMAIGKRRINPDANKPKLTAKDAKALSVSSVLKRSKCAESVVDKILDDILNLAKDEKNVCWVSLEPFVLWQGYGGDKMMKDSVIPALENLGYDVNIIDTRNPEFYMSVRW